MDLCRSVGRGQPWPAAFQQVFDLIVDDFYQRFADARPQSIR